MPSQIRGFGDRLLDEPQADIVAAIVLLALSALYAGLTWARFPLSDDKYWYMQVAAQVDEDADDEGVLVGDGPSVAQPGAL